MSTRSVSLSHAVTRCEPPRYRLIGLAEVLFLLVAGLLMVALWLHNREGKSSDDTQVVPTREPRQADASRYGEVGR